MSKKAFPIFTPIVDGFKGFRQHWMLLLCAGALVSSIHLFDAYLMPVGSGKLHQEVGQVGENLFRSQNAQEFFNHIGSLYSFFRGHPEPLRYYGYGLAFLALRLFLMFGLIGICLALGGKKKVSLAMFLSDARQYLRLIGASALCVGLVILFGIALIALEVILAWFMLPLGCKLMCAFAALLVFLWGMMHFVFIAWCAADKAKSVFEVMSCSVNLVRGNVMRLIVFTVLVAFIMALFGGLLGGLLAACAAFLPGVCAGFSLVLVLFLGMAALTPLSFMVWTSAYKHLK